MIHEYTNRPFLLFQEDPYLGCQEFIFFFVREGSHKFGAVVLESAWVLPIGMHLYEGINYQIIPR
jgi:hypothetical protein